MVTSLFASLVVACSVISSISAQDVVCQGHSEGLFPNPFDCGGYYQCANGISQPFVRKCAPGSHFDQNLRQCLAIPDVHCNDRPVVDTLQQPTRRVAPTNFQSNVLLSRPNVQSNIPVRPALVTPNSANSVTLRLSSRSGGPALRTDQCSEIGRQLSRQLRTLVGTYDLSCTATSPCQQNLPTFRVDCQPLAG